MHFQVEASTLRAALRIYFLITCSLIALIGDQCCLLRSKVSLARDRPVNLTHTTGWMRGPPLLYSIYRLRRLPGGAVLGTFMVLLTITALLADLAVSGFVRAVSVPAVCTFDKGLVFPAKEADVSLDSHHPGFMSKAFSWGFSSQVASLGNGGLTGIYHKTYNGTEVRARREDVRATWGCGYDGEPHLYDSDTDIGTIADDLIEAGLFFGDFRSVSVSWWEGMLSHHIGLSASWSNASEPATSSVSPEVRLFFSEFDDHDHNTTHIAVLKCTMGDADGPTKMVARIIDMSRILGDATTFVSSQLWDEVTQYRPVVDPLQTAELWLNALVMTAGTAGSITRTAEGSLNGSEYGCLRVRTDVPWPVVTLFLLTVGLFVLFSVYGVVLFVWLYRFKRRSTDAAASRKLLKYTPNDLVSWMRHATSETQDSSVSSIAKERELVHWSLSTVSELWGTRLGVVQREKGSVEMDDAPSRGNQAHVAVVDDRSPTLVSQSPMPVQKQTFESEADEFEAQRNEGRDDRNFLITRKMLRPSGAL